MKKFPALYQASREVARATVTSINALIAHMPEPLKARATAEVADLGKRVDALPEAGSVKDDDATEVSLNALDVLTVSNRSMAAQLDETSRLLESHATSLNRLAELETKITAGDLVEKSAVEALASTARAEGEASARAAAQRASERRESLAKCGLPSAPEPVLSLADEEFATRRKQAEARAVEMKTAGISINGVFGASIWQDEAVYQRDLLLVKESLKCSQGGAAPAAPAPKRLVV